MSIPAGYKPSPLGYGSPRSSPFRRPESPASPASLRQTTPPTSPSRQPGRMNVNAVASRFAPPTSPSSATPVSVESRTPTRGNITAGYFDSNSAINKTSPNSMHTPIQPQPAGLRSPVAMKSSMTTATGGSAVSQLQPSQVRMLREGFQILDRDSDGVVNRDDVADMLTQLGLPSSPASITPFFPPPAPQTTTLAVFLNTLSASLAALSPSSELLSAFSAFDDDDSGQIDMAELRDALLHTAPEPGEQALTPQEVDKVMSGFTGRRAFSKGGFAAGGGLGGQKKRGEVFKYQEFVNSVVGGGGGANGNSGNGKGSEDGDDDA